MPKEISSQIAPEGTALRIATIRTLLAWWNSFLKVSGEADSGTLEMGGKVFVLFLFLLFFSSLFAQRWHHRNHLSFDFTF